MDVAPAKRAGSAPTSWLFHAPAQSRADARAAIGRDDHGLGGRRIGRRFARRSGGPAQPPQADEQAEQQARAIAALNAQFVVGVQQ
jgi:hypothetical protein